VPPIPHLPRAREQKTLSAATARRPVRKPGGLRRHRRPRRS
jgi:hypothetical protein